MPRTSPAKSPPAAIPSCPVSNHNDSAGIFQGSIFGVGNIIFYPGNIFHPFDLLQPPYYLLELIAVVNFNAEGAARLLADGLDSGIGNVRPELRKNPRYFMQEAGPVGGK